MIKFKNDFRIFTKNLEEKSLLKKIYFVNSNPGLKIVLMNRFINELPQSLSVIKILLKYFYTRTTVKYGIDLPLNTDFGERLQIFHYGGIIINPNTKIGNNCAIMQGVTLGNNMKNNFCPTISDKVLIGAGAKIIGDVFLAEGIKVGANAVVTKSFYEPNISIGGIPAKKISSKLDNE